MAKLDSWNGAPDVWSSVRVAGQGQGGVLDRVRKGRTPTPAPWAGSVVGGRKLGLMLRRKRKQGGCLPCGRREQGCIRECLLKCD